MMAIQTVFSQINIHWMETINTVCFLQEVIEYQILTLYWNNVEMCAVNPHGKI